ncbi:alkaline phosphatase [Chamaesiphon sp. OTE_75_metabat_556]|uniref:alkaline phosphatase n=1 Tax=Chamaesiphon sp. OTE_75_metabat_556 TaxID=2964692 RepID=UPI00286CE3B2|nr:alkaline phosphatase [Chamaesiphon sp. OTE_75_metabat_556]
MAKNTIIMIGDGMGWEMTRAAAIYKQIQEGKTGTSLSDYYTSGKGTGLNMQTLTGYTLATTYGTTVPNSSGVYNTGQAAIADSKGVVGNTGLTTTTNVTYSDISGFDFNTTFNPGTTPTGGAKVSDGVVGNLVGYDPVKGGATPWTAGTEKEYIKYSYPDSANTATTLYSGVKTYNGAVGVDIFENPVESVLSKAAQAGKSTGLVTSVPIDHATPAAAAANVNNRNKFDNGYEDTALDSILQQELRVYQPTVLLGGGHPLSSTGNVLPNGVEPRDNTYIKESTYQELSKNPTSNIYDYTFVERGTDAASKLASTAASLDPEKGDRLLGLYGARGQDGNLPVSSANGDYSTTGLAMFTVNSTKGLNPDTVRPLKAGETDASFIATERNQNPTLDDLTKAALTVLGKDPDGMWLMIEGGDIDWAAHDNNIDNLIGATLDFDKAVGSVIDWINKNGGWADNELIVTADHDHYLTLNGDFPTLVQKNASNGISALTDNDTIAGSGQTWGSSTTDKYDWGNHTNRPVPVYYQGPESSLLTASIGTGYEAYGKEVKGIPGLIDQVDIAQTMFASVAETSQQNLVSGTPGSDTEIAKVGGTIDGVQDTIYTGNGNDTIDLAFNSNARNNTVDAGKGDDTIFVSRNDTVFGGEGNDTFYAIDGKGENRMSGGAGNDTFYLGSNDRALGGDGNDKFYAGSGGGNTLSGGAGADQFWIATGSLPSSANTIADFQIGTDVIGISGSKSLGISSSTLKLNQTSADTTINFGTQTLAVLTGIQASSLNTSNSSQFVFG